MCREMNPRVIEPFEDHKPMRFQPQRAKYATAIWSAPTCRRFPAGRLVAKRSATSHGTESGDKSPHSRTRRPRPLLTLLTLSTLLTTLPAQARINVVTLPGRDSVQLTIYNSVDLTLVKETRLLTFRKGLNRLEFSWANTLIDPTSVEFRALTHADAVDVLDVSFPPRVTNTLEWRIKSEFAGEVQAQIRYFTSGINWAADYVAAANKPEQLMAL